MTLIIMMVLLINGLELPAEVFVVGFYYPAGCVIGSRLEIFAAGEKPLFPVQPYTDLSPAARAET
jgi:hypothetical protein